MAESFVIAGVGNPHRGDDGAGWAVIDALQEKLGARIPCIKLQGNLTELMDLFSRYRTVYLIDACVGSSPWQRIDARLEKLPDGPPQTSTHGFGVAEAIKLAEELGEVPDQLIVYAIKGTRFGMGESLSKEVGTQIPFVIDALLQEEELSHARISLNEPAV